MITKGEFLNNLRSGGVDVTEFDAEVENFDELANIALKVSTAIPSIGFASVHGRINCFMAVCRHLDQLIEAGEISLSDTHIILAILRMKHSSFRKAIAMFDFRSSRFGVRDRLEMAASAREYLAGLQLFG